jgi:hypothetical protein
MSTDLIRTQLETGIALGSLRSLVKATADYPMLLIDVSGSMQYTLRANGKSRVEALREIVAQIRQERKDPMIAFGGRETEAPRFVDHVPDADGGTPLHLAITLAQQHGATRLVVISDGLPDLQDEAMARAKAFGGRVDVVFVGDPGEPGSFFLDELARATGGQRLEGDLAQQKQLKSAVAGLLEGEVEPQRAPIQGVGFVAEESEPEEPEEPELEDEDDEEDDDDDDDEDDE